MKAKRLSFLGSVIPRIGAKILFDNIAGSNFSTQCVLLTYSSLAIREYHFLEIYSLISSFCVGAKAF